MAYQKATSSEYIAWVQRCLNRELEFNLKDNGIIAAPYRELVAELNWKYLMRPNFQQVDLATQNMMVELSNARDDYMRWVQLSLKAAGAYGSAPTGVLDKATKDGILAFQGYHNLRDDAWVGPDTEAFLIRVVGKSAIPGRHSGKPAPKPGPKKPTDPRTSEQKVQDWARLLREDLQGDGSVDAQRKQRMRCVLGKLRSPAVGHFNDRYIGPVEFHRYLNGSNSHLTFRQIIESHAKRLKLELAALVTSSSSYAAFVKSFNDLFDDVEKGIALIQAYHSGSVRDAQIYTYSDRLLAIHNWSIQKSKDTADIYACFRG